MNKEPDPLEGNALNPPAKHYVDGGYVVYPTAQRPWVGLTHEDIVIILNNDYGGSRADCIRAAEARLKEKNNG